MVGLRDGGGGGGWGMRAREFVHLNWASHFWPPIQKFVFPERKIVLLLAGWSGLERGLGPPGQPPPPPGPGCLLKHTTTPGPPPPPPSRCPTALSPALLTLCRKKLLKAFSTTIQGTTKPMGMLVRAISVAAPEPALKGFVPIIHGHLTHKGALRDDVTDKELSWNVGVLCSLIAQAGPVLLKYEVECLPACRGAKGRPSCAGVAVVQGRRPPPPPPVVGGDQRSSLQSSACGLCVWGRHATSICQGNWFSVAIRPVSKATQ